MGVFGSIEKYSGRLKKVICVEHSLGQMVDDVRLAVESRGKVEFIGKPGGGIVTPEEVVDKVESCLKDKVSI